MAKRRRHLAKPSLPADNETFRRPADLFRGHDPAEVEQRLIEVFSGMPCDLGSDDMAPPDWPADAELHGRTGGDLTVNRAADHPRSTDGQSKDTKPPDRVRDSLT